MNQHGTQLAELNVADLIKADWNYKSDASAEMLEKLCASISKDHSAGVLAVREMESGQFEVIDGNHRFQAVCELGWEKVPCENFGEISLAHAVTVARRRNHQWFEDDPLAFAELYRDVVLPEYSVGELEQFMPDSQQELEDLAKLLDFDWGEFDQEETREGARPSGEIEITVSLSKEQAELVTAELERVGGETANALVRIACTSQNFELAQIEEYYQQTIRQWSPETAEEETEEQDLIPFSS